MTMKSLLRAHQVWSLGGSGTGGANTGSGTGSPSGGGRFNHSYDSLAWE